MNTLFFNSRTYSKSTLVLVLIKQMTPNKKLNRIITPPFHTLRYKPSE